MAINNVTIVGRFVADPELKTTPQGTSVTSFTFAVDRYAGQGKERKTDFPTVVAWRGLAEHICKHFSKGQKAVINGSIQTRNYEDKQGHKRKVTEIVAEEIDFASSKREASAQESPAMPEAAPEADDFENVLTDEDLPF